MFNEQKIDINPPKIDLLEVDESLTHQIQDPSYWTMCPTIVLLILSSLTSAFFFLPTHINGQSAKIASNVLKPLTAGLLSISLIFAGLLCAKQIRWAQIRLLVGATAFLIFMVGDVHLNGISSISNLGGTICFLIGNIILGISLILGNSLREWNKISLGRIILTCIFTMMALIVSITTSVILGVIFHVSIGLVIGCFFYLMSHAIVRTLILILPYSTLAGILGVLGSISYQTCDALVLIFVLGNRSFGSDDDSVMNQINLPDYLRDIYMAFYYPGLILLCYSLLVVNLPRMWGSPCLSM